MSSSTPSFGSTPHGRAESTRIKAHLIFEVGNQPYACPIENIEHVLRRADAQIRPPSAAAPAWEIGRVVRSGSDLPIISLRTLWGIPGPSSAGLRESLLIVRLPGQSFALLVEACLTVISSLPPETIKFQLPAPLLGPRGSAFETVLQWKQSLLVTLQLNRLVTSEFTGLLAASAQNSTPI